MHRIAEPGDGIAKTLDSVAQRPKVGQRVRIGGRVGVICEPNDPARSGTYESKAHGPLPIKWVGNRAERRKAIRAGKGR